MREIIGWHSSRRSDLKYLKKETLNFSSFFIPRHFKKFGVLCYTLHSKNCVRVPVVPSVCLSVRPSVSASFSLSAGSIFNQFSSNLLWELILGRSVIGLQIGKFCQISTELRPLIDVRNRFSLSIFDIPLPIFFKLGLRVNIVKECSVIADG